MRRRPLPSMRGLQQLRRKREPAHRQRAHAACGCGCRAGGGRIRTHANEFDPHRSTSKKGTTCRQSRSRVRKRLSAARRCRRRRLPLRVCRVPDHPAQRGGGGRSSRPQDLGRADEGLPRRARDSRAASASVRETVDRLTEGVVRALLRSRPGGGTFHIEDVQDHVELALMRGGHHEVARPTCCTGTAARRSARARPRCRHPRPRNCSSPTADGGVPLDMAALKALVEGACAGLGDDVKPEPILAETRRNLYDGVRSTRSTRPRSWLRAPCSRRSPATRAPPRAC